MNKEHMKRLNDIVNDYDHKHSLPIVVNTYSRLQTKYLSRDLNKGLYVPNLFTTYEYGELAINVMERYAKMHYKPKIDYNDFHAW